MSAEYNWTEPGPPTGLGGGPAVFSGGKVETRKPTPFKWRDPKTIPPRPFTYGTHYQRKTMSASLAPGAVGKTSLSIVEALAMVTGRALLGEVVPEPIKVWLINLEEPTEELERRVAAAVLHHNINPAELEGRLFIDGNDFELCVATQGRNGVKIVEPFVDSLCADINELEIDHLTVDPFVKSHRVTENDNGAIEAVANTWAGVARDCNVSVGLYHHTRKANGQELTSEDSRGGSSLVNAARDARILNKATREIKESLGVDVREDKGTYFSVTQDKPNMSTGSGAKWYRTVGVDIGNGDSVAAVESYAAPNAFDGISPADTLAVQKAVDALEDPRENEQATNWVGYTVADTLGLSLPKDKRRVKSLLRQWLENGVFKKTKVKDEKGNERPGIAVGEWITDLGYLSSPTTTPGGGEGCG